MYVYLLPVQALHVCQVANLAVTCKDGHLDLVRYKVYSVVTEHVTDKQVDALLIQELRVLPRNKQRQSEWAWFGRSLCPHQSFELPH